MELWLDKQQEVRKGVKVRAGFVLRVDIFTVALRSEPRTVRTCGLCVMTGLGLLGWRSHFAGQFEKSANPSGYFSE